ncbi:FadR/GntR family transcriptional regulator [Histidinibacterium aquaticum]|uniref:FadR family transcriptional regulator n=1 Tax=Histidinibacterium aquaticum TaxID=2613962 RepID=A0A5J5GAE7_9RHOB|nr:FCD domain-containing protein [Histidinibacterium aquaticum]KAA9004998.1 FadR family transcriptional regulator [Histidinibacterium aquaticum]
MRTDKQTAKARLWAVLEERAPASGDRLPPERVLKDLVGCSRETLRAALSALEAEGEVWRHVGQGTFRGRAPLGRPVKDTLLLEATTPADLMDARRLLEPQVASAAAARRTPEDLSLLRLRVAEGRKSRDRAASERADDAFHQSIAQVARNPLLIALLRHFSSARCRAVWQREWDRTYRRIGVEEFTRVHCDHHEHVVDAIEAGDGRAAHRAMARHLEAVSIEMGVRDHKP